MAEAGRSPARFTAVQEYAVDRVAFVWRARFTIAGFVPLRVSIATARGEGSLESRLFGSIRLTRERGQDVAEGQASAIWASCPGCRTRCSATTRSS